MHGRRRPAVYSVWETTRYWLRRTNEKPASTISCRGQAAPPLRSLFCLPQIAEEHRPTPWGRSRVSIDGSRLLCAYLRESKFIRNSTFLSYLSDYRSNQRHDEGYRALSRGFAPPGHKTKRSVQQNIRHSSTTNCCRADKTEDVVWCYRDHPTRKKQYSH